MNNDITRIIISALFYLFSFKLWKSCQGPKIAFYWNFLKIMVGQGIKIAQNISCRLPFTGGKVEPISISWPFQWPTMLHIKLRHFPSLQHCKGEIYLRWPFHVKSLETQIHLLVHMLTTVAVSSFKACRRTAYSRLRHIFFKKYPQFCMDKLIFNSLTKVRATLS